ncbi:sensor histidine kinase [Caenimonas koreensis]|uniref:histidine kinase n=1 Tax=Caenimonas koreensis DSM 17982 TaxID=1121255 RepID=A0A844AWD1_9BURK|nr:sensor histidine kinase N-terminal domain-containing protein [Caenimonas koreensis]MRD48810.1 sensor histidine kinase [Caenimonas koreensis DSM 17982]
MLSSGSNPPSLRSRLARHVLLPVALSWVLGSVVLLIVGNHFAAQAFDRALLDDAYAIAAQVRKSGDALVLELTPQEVSTLLFDQSETLYFSVFDTSGRLVAGSPGLPAPQLPPGAAHEFADAVLDGASVRRVSLRRDEASPFTVVMAQTTASRTQLLQRLIGYSAMVQLWLLATLAWWLSRIIEHDLRPLTQLQQAMEQRDAGDLAPLPAELTQGATTQDVRRLGDALDSLLTRLAASLAAQREFAGNVAHELRTPLAGIRAQAHYALAQENPQAWRAELEGIVLAEERASRLIDQLLALARAGEGSAGLHSEAIALDALVRDVVLRYLRKADALGVDFGAEGLEDSVVVRGDPALIEGMLNNLIDNALRYGRGEPARVTVAIEREPGFATLAVTDNGPGLQVSEVDALTQRWAQGAQGQRLGEGAGLGLSIVQRYAALLDAQFVLQPAPSGKGLRASVRFRL